MIQRYNTFFMKIDTYFVSYFKASLTIHNTIHDMICDYNTIQ